MFFRLFPFCTTGYRYVWWMGSSVDIVLCKPFRLYHSRNGGSRSLVFSQLWTGVLVVIVKSISWQLLQRCISTFPDLPLPLEPVLDAIPMSSCHIVPASDIWIHLSHKKTGAEVAGIAKMNIATTASHEKHIGCLT